MTLKFLTVKITRSELCAFVEDVPAWEAPLLEALHEQFSVLGEVYIDRPAPDLGDEFQRLMNRYPKSLNDDGSKGPALVTVVYGAGKIGERNLADAINASVSSRAANLTAEDLRDLMGTAA